MIRYEFLKYESVFNAVFNPKKFVYMVVKKEYIWCKIMLPYTSKKIKNDKNP